MFTCATSWMKERVVAPEPANVQYVVTLVYERSRVGRTHRFLVRWTALFAYTTSIKCAESSADGVVITRNVDTRVKIL